MNKKLSFLPIFCLVVSAFGHYSGPFLLWGIDDLKDVEVSALEGVDDKLLRDLYSNAAAVVIFLRNGTTKLSHENFPGFKEIVDQNEYVYLPQQYLTSDPLDYNVNAEIINLVGSPSQQDVELSALYRDSTSNYGDRKVLGILANRWDEHELRKREVRAEETTIVPTATANPTEEPMMNDYIYNAIGKAILYTTEAPVIKTIALNSSDDDDTTTISLETHTLTTYDVRSERESKLIVTFKVDESTKLTLKFRFEFSESGNWCLPKVDVLSLDTRGREGMRNLDTTLEVEGNVPCAPIGFSFKCSQTINFRNGTTLLVLENIQVQPALDGATRFGSAYDCVGFTTAPIWSGIFITSLMLIVMSIAITAILDIKPPNRFESKAGKQLTFTIQE